MDSNISRLFSIFYGHWRIFIITTWTTGNYVYRMFPGNVSFQFLFLLLSSFSASVAFSSIAIQHSFAAFFVCYGLVFGLGMGIAYVTAVATVINVSHISIFLKSSLLLVGTRYCGACEWDSGCRIWGILFNICTNPNGLCQPSQSTGN